jgi:hypothetical protein
LKLSRGRPTIHGQRAAGQRSRTYVSWNSTRQRCNNPKAPNYANYGGRGITICKRWDSFANFLVDMGERPDRMSLDRIDSYGNYEPENCRWSTKSTQRLNQRCNGNCLCGGQHPLKRA